MDSGGTGRETGACAWPPVDEVMLIQYSGLSISISGVDKMDGAYNTCNCEHGMVQVVCCVLYGTYRIAAAAFWLLSAFNSLFFLSNSPWSYSSFIISGSAYHTFT